MLRLKVLLNMLLLVFLTSCATSSGSGERIAAAIDNPNRTAADRERDARDNPAEILALLNLSSGDAVADLFGGGGYYAELLAGVVGEGGSVVLQNNRGYAKWVDAYLQERYVDNTVLPILVLMSESDELGLSPGSLDAAIMVMTYHDLYYLNPERGFPRTDVEQFFAQVSVALKPAGKLLIIDHSAPEGSGQSLTQEIHRIDPAFAKQDIESRGFSLTATSDVLSNPDDPRKDNVFAKAIRGKTDRFVMLFKKN